MALETLLVGLWGNFVNSLPGLIAAIVTLIIGLIIGKVVGRIVKEIFIRLKVDEFVLEGEKMVFRFSDIFSVIARWWIYLVFIQAAAEFLGIAAVTVFVSEIISFIPGLIKGALIIIVGYVLAEYIKDKIVSKKTIYGSIVGKIIFFLLLYISVALALPLLGIDATIVNWILLILIASVGLGIAIATGLGLKDVVAANASEYMKKAKRRK